jgi:hypothetical protein
MLLQKTRHRKLVGVAPVKSTSFRVHGLAAAGVTRYNASARAEQGGGSSKRDAERLLVFDSSLSVVLLEARALGDARPDLSASIYCLNFNCCGTHRNKSNTGQKQAALGN